MIDWLQAKKQAYQHLPWATLSLLIANVIAYTVLVIGYEFSIWNIFVPKEKGLATWGQYNRAIMEEGQIYRLGTALFVHAHIVHLLSNLLFLSIFGIRLEDMRSSRELVAIYFISGLVGNLLTLLWGLEYLSVGASGAVFGVFGGNLMFLRRYYRQQMRTAFFIAFIFFTITIGVDTNVLAHAGGLCTGLLFGYYIGRRSMSSSSQLSRARSRHRKKKRRFS
ncbi:MAG: rhomboid family intramembrane serine protease [Candidatus Hodarchaeales archaeon]|jgi:rhomboid protease GluP